MDSQDILGLDQPIKLGRVSRIPKLTDELLLSNIRGLPQIRDNYKKLSVLLRKVDRAYSEKIKKSASKSAARQLKVACQTEKLQKVLLFYQLWCHGLFPRANFKDCIQMLRKYSSFSMKEYRRGLLNNEIHKLKIEKGIISEEPPVLSDPEDDDLYLVPNVDSRQEGNSESTINATIQDDEDDWGFLSIRRGNQLFVADNDEKSDEDPEKETAVDTNSSTKSTRASIIDGDEDDGELLDLIPSEFLTQTRTNAPAESNPEIFAEEYPDHEEELEIMREMGM